MPCLVRFNWVTIDRCREKKSQCVGKVSWFVRWLFNYYYYFFRENVHQISSWLPKLHKTGRKRCIVKEIIPSLLSENAFMFWCFTYSEWVFLFLSHSNTWKMLTVWFLCCDRCVQYHQFETSHERNFIAS